MSLQSRALILDQLQDDLKSPVLSYVTGDRPGIGTQISSDQLLLFPRHLAALGENNQLNLVLYTRGGDTAAAWPIMSFMREHCKTLRVLVPFYAHSAGTLLALGADEIVMTRYASLSPIDPTVANQFNPQDPANPANRLPIAVEDVMAFIELAEHSAADPSLRDDAFRKLTDAVHPLALGNVQRNINQIRQLARKMLALHASPKQTDKIEALVNALTTQLYSHQHLVNRREATEVGLQVVPASEKTEALLLQYYEQLCQDLQLRKTFDPASIIRAASTAAGAAVQGQTPPAQQPAPTVPTVPAVSLTVPISVEQGYVETAKTCDAYVTEGEISQIVTNQQQQFPGLPMPVITQQLATRFEVFNGDWRSLA